MAKPRVYRDGMQCPKCGFNWLPKYGHSRGKQTYWCGHCLHHFMPESEHLHQPEAVKKLAVYLYAEGNSMEAISRALGSGSEGWDRLLLGQKNAWWAHAGGLGLPAVRGSPALGEEQRAELRDAVQGLPARVGVGLANWN